MERHADRARVREVLVVEDSGTDAGLILRALKRGGRPMHITLLTNGEKAASHLDACESPMDIPVVKPDLVLMDLELPRIGGLELLEEMRRQALYRDVPVVVFTGSDRSQDLSDSYRLGANCVVYKPVKTEDFVSVVRSVEHYWLDVVGSAGGQAWPKAS